VHFWMKTVCFTEGSMSSRGIFHRKRLLFGEEPYVPPKAP
jgi:hypothetical protein